MGPSLFGLKEEHIVVQSCASSMTAIEKSTLGVQGQITNPILIEKIKVLPFRVAMTRQIRHIQKKLENFSVFTQSVLLSTVHRHTDILNITKQ